jgi:hypothetical protein
MYDYPVVTQRIRVPVIITGGVFQFLGSAGYNEAVHKTCQQQVFPDLMHVS